MMISEQPRLVSFKKSKQNPVLHRYYL